MDIGDTLNVFENSLRDLVEVVLRKAYGDRWFDELGVTADRIEAWKSRREEEPKRRPGGEVEQRLLYYAEFYDVTGIMLRNWDSGFGECFGSKPRFKVYSDRLAAFRNPDAHSRALFPFEEHLVIGITGELRQQIALFLSRGGGGPEPEHFPRIEEVRDSYGMRVVGSASAPWQSARSGVILRPGDKVSFTARAWDPESAALKWRLYRATRHDFIHLDGHEIEWEWTVQEEDIGESSFVTFSLQSERPYHRNSDGFDDTVTLFYKVLPPTPF